MSRGEIKQVSMSTQDIINIYPDNVVAEKQLQGLQSYLGITTSISLQLEVLM